MRHTSGYGGEDALGANEALIRREDFAVWGDVGWSKFMFLFSYMEAFGVIGCDERDDKEEGNFGGELGPGYILLSGGVDGGADRRRQDGKRHLPRKGAYEHRKKQPHKHKFPTQWQQKRHKGKKGEVKYDEADDGAGNLFKGG